MTLAINSRSKWFETSFPRDEAKKNGTGAIATVFGNKQLKLKANGERGFAHNKSQRFQWRDCRVSIPVVQWIVMEFMFHLSTVPIPPVIVALIHDIHCPPPSNLRPSNANVLTCSNCLFRINEMAFARRQIHSQNKYISGFSYVGNHKYFWFIHLGIAMQWQKPMRDRNKESVRQCPLSDWMFSGVLKLNSRCDVGNVHDRHWVCLLLVGVRGSIGSILWLFPMDFVGCSDLKETCASQLFIRCFRNAGKYITATMNKLWR